MKNTILRLLAISWRLRRHFVALCATQLITNYLSLNTSAQAPLGIPYQAIARNASGAAIASTAVRVRFSIRDSIATGIIRYQETHNPTTSALGLFSVNVGRGTVVSGSFAGINWGRNAKFLQVELDPAGGTSYTDLGTTQMMSVPYALNALTAQTAANGLNNGTATNQMMYWNGSSWTTLNPGSNGQTLTICNGVLTWTTGGVCPSVLSTLSTTSASAITTTTASSGGNITSDGGGTITARGVCWSTSQNPTIALTTKTSNGTGTGSFSSSLTGLSPNTLYYVRAYATNSAGTAYGNQVSFTTLVSTNPVDADGNTYTTVSIGTQVWMKENLKVSKYRNGDPIPTNLSDAAWSTATTGAYAIYNNDAANNTLYGKLYNWYAVADPRGLCPTGWHVPTDAEWYFLENYLDPTVNDPNATGYRGTDVGGKLKAVSSLWTGSNTSATNSSGFTGLPGGSRFNGGSFESIGANGVWWSSPQGSSSAAWYRVLDYFFAGSDRNVGNKSYGFSVRCLRD
jgi:uncharacterized protein (TIGR02145 family)